MPLTRYYFLGIASCALSALFVTYQHLGRCFLSSLQSLCVSGAARNQRTSCPGHRDGGNPSTATFSEITCAKKSYESPYSQPPLKSKSWCTDGLRNVILNICKNRAVTRIRQAFGYQSLVEFYLYTNANAVI